MEKRGGGRKEREGTKALASRNNDLLSLYSARAGISRNSSAYLWSCRSTPLQRSLTTFPMGKRRTWQGGSVSIYEQPVAKRVAQIVLCHAMYVIWVRTVLKVAPSSASAIATVRSFLQIKKAARHGRTCTYISRTRGSICRRGGSVEAAAICSVSAKGERIPIPFFSKANHRLHPALTFAAATSGTYPESIEPRQA